MFGEGHRAHRLTRFGAADVNDVAARRLMLKVVIEAHDAMDFGARKVKGMCNQRNALGRNPSEIVLNAAQNRHQRAGLVFEGGDDRNDRRPVP